MTEDSYTISTLAKALKTCSDDAFIQNVFKMLDETEVDITSDEVLLNVVLDAFVRLKDMRRLNGVVRKVRDMKMVPPVATVNTIMKAFSSLKRVDDAMELWRVMTEVRELEPNEISIGCVTDALVSNDRVDEAADFVEKWKARIPLNTVIYSTLIKGFAINRQADRALRAFEQMQEEGIAPNLVTMNTLLDACARSGRMARCGEILEDMQKVHGVDPDRITFSTIVKGFCLAGEIQQAIAVMESARRRGFPADVIIFNTILDACSSRDQFHLRQALHADGGGGRQADELHPHGAHQALRPRGQREQGLRDHGQPAAAVRLQGERAGPHLPHLGLRDQQADEPRDEGLRAHEVEGPGAGLDDLREAHLRLAPAQRRGEGLRARPRRLRPQRPARQGARREERGGERHRDPGRPRHA